MRDQLIIEYVDDNGVHTDTFTCRDACQAAVALYLWIERKIGKGLKATYRGGDGTEMVTEM